MAIYYSIYLANVFGRPDAAHDTSTRPAKTRPTLGRCVGCRFGFADYVVHLTLYARARRRRHINGDSITAAARRFVCGC